MRLGDDPPGLLAVDISANRAVEMAVVAEEAANQCDAPHALRYVIGTEVPIAGGLKEDEKELEVTAVPDLKQTIEKTRTAFFSKGLEFCMGAGDCCGRPAWC